MNVDKLRYDMALCTDIARAHIKRAEANGPGDLENMILAAFYAGKAVEDEDILRRETGEKLTDTRTALIERLRRFYEMEG